MQICSPPLRPSLGNSPHIGECLIKSQSNKYPLLTISSEMATQTPPTVPYDYPAPRGLYSRIDAKSPKSSTVNLIGCVIHLYNQTTSGDDMIYQERLSFDPSRPRETHRDLVVQQMGRSATGSPADKLILIFMGKRAAEDNKVGWAKLMYGLRESVISNEDVKSGVYLLGGIGRRIKFWKYNRLDDVLEELDDDTGIGSASVPPTKLLDLFEDSPIIDACFKKMYRDWRQVIGAQGEFSFPAFKFELSCILSMPLYRRDST